jgi:MFS family permease
MAAAVRQMNRQAGSGGANPWFMLALVVSCTVLGLMGTDLILPALPALPDALGGTIAQSQGVLAAYVGATCVGLLAWAALGDRIGTATLIVASLFLTALVSAACRVATSIEALIALRVLQGAVAAAPAVFAPGIVRAVFDERGGVRALGILGSIEALAPALAPILGAWLVTIGDWRTNFAVLGALAGVLGIAVMWRGHLPQVTRRPRGSYLRLLRDATFLRYALSQAFVLGGLLVIVFAMPNVFVHVLGADLRAFVAMQVCGICAFILTANGAGYLVSRLGPENLIWLGTMVATAGALALLALGLAGGRSAWWVVVMFIPINAGLGLRGPPGFFRAVVAARGDDARGAALVILLILATASLGTAIAAPLLERGLAPVAAVAAALEIAALACLALLPALRDGPAVQYGRDTVDASST